MVPPAHTISRLRTRLSEVKDLTEYIPQIVACLPSVVIGLVVWRMEKKMEQGFRAQEEREAAREENEVLLVQATGASIALGEAAALALKNGNTNGETEAALEYAREIKHKQKDFLTRQAAKSLT